jgi:hypothetical protein
LKLRLILRAAPLVELQKKKKKENAKSSNGEIHPVEVGFPWSIARHLCQTMNLDFSESSLIVTFDAQGSQWVKLGKKQRRGGWKMNEGQLTRSSHLGS